jgi:hypothetical protein
MMSFNLPKRSSTSKQPSTQTDTRPTSGLLKALMETGRTKGSSATPAPSVISPNPDRDFQAQIDKMNTSSLSRDNQGQDMSSANTRPRSSSQYPGFHNRSLSSVTQQSFQTGGYTSRNVSPGPGAPQFRPGENQGLGPRPDEVKFAFPVRFSAANVFEANDCGQTWSSYP